MLLHNRKHTPDSGTTALKAALRVTAAAAWIGIMSTGASAGTVVTEWDFMLDNAFTDFTQTGTGGDITGSEFNPKISALEGMPVPSKLSWGVPFGQPNQSSLAIGFSNGNFDSTTDGGPMNNMSTPILTKIDPSLVPPAAAPHAGNTVATVKVTHENFPQAIGTAALDTAVLTDILMLTPVMPNPPFDGSTTASPVALQFNIKFAETSNVGNDGDINNGDGTETPNNCADTDSPAGGGCNDIFVLDVPLAAFDPLDASLNQLFAFDDFLYNAKIQLSGLGPIGGTGLGMLTDAECAAADSTFVADANPLNNCIGLTTQENMVNEFQAFLSIQLVGAVAEPGPLAIFGLGLAGLGFMRRRRQV